METTLESRLEPNHWTEARWAATLACLLRYIDDSFSLSKVNFENGIEFAVNGVQYRIKHAVQAQNIFRHMVKKAEGIGMKVNSSKTAMLCVSGARSFEAESFIEDKDLCRIGCQETMKVLGMRFSRRPNMDAHVEWLRKSFRQRYWTIRNLKNSGFTEEELVRVYKTIIRPVEDYGAVVYHSSLTAEQTQDLERLQDHALKCIYGAELSARELREQTGLTTLAERRIGLCRKFSSKLVSHPLFEHLFPKKATRASHRGNPEIYLETKGRCDRLKNSPISFYRRLLNKKE